MASGLSPFLEGCLIDSCVISGSFRLFRNDIGNFANLRCCVVCRFSREIGQRTSQFYIL